MAVSQFTQLPLAPQEDWRPVVGYEGIYEVSDRGRVRRVAPGKATQVGRILRPMGTNTGYLCVKLSNAQGSANRLIHQLVASAFLGPCPPGHEVHHIDAQRDNPALSNLRYVTRSENQREAYALGTKKPGGACTPGHRNPFGVAANRAKLTEGQVRAIRESSEATKVLAARFGVGLSTILRVKSGESYPVDKVAS